MSVGLTFGNACFSYLMLYTETLPGTEVVKRWIFRDTRGMSSFGLNQFWMAGYNAWPQRVLVSPFLVYVLLMIFLRHKRFGGTC